MIARVVIGANFGDEGKGLVTDYLCAKGAGVVVRFNGGAQAGHTVVSPDNERHVFHHFGSGTMCEVPTYLSQLFVCNPILFFQELETLQELGFRPDVYAHPDCLITTFMDMLINQHKEEKRAGKRHGSCGIGFHETITRSKLPELKITLGDLWNGSSRLEGQMAELCGKYSKFRTGQIFDDSKAVEAFLACCKAFAEYVQPAGMAHFKDPVFEGAQGLLLDQNRKDFFPHVTHSNTGMKNVEVLCAQAGITQKEIYYVSRTYLTRHGAGPLPGEDDSLSFDDDTNLTNQFQGSIRFAPLDSGLRKRCKEDCQQPYKLVLTHCDQLEPTLEADFYCDDPRRTGICEKLSALVLP